ncbi:MAG: hypothetical protein H7841_09495 [Magnetospirillum sp. WYHS-4]
MTARRMKKPLSPVLRVKAEARRRINARFPEWRQANMTARAVELIRRGEATWTEAEQAEAALIDAAWAWIKSVRAASDAIEVRLAAEPGLEIGDDDLWPDF